MDLHNHIKQWTQSSFNILDVRYTLIPASQHLPPYRLPANAFLLICRGQGNVAIDDVTYNATHSHVFHASKGFHVHVSSVEPMAYYLVLYRTDNSALWKDKENDAEAVMAPFGLMSEHPAVLHRQVREMYEAWTQDGDLSQFKARAVFYSFIHEILQQLDSQSALSVKADMVDQTIRYIEEHFNEPVTLDDIASALNYNVQYLSRKFKARMGRSPIDYLIHVRMDQAVRLLLETDATVQDVADSVGYADLFYFIRRFKKHTGLVPGQFRKRAAEGKLPDVPSRRLKSSILQSPSPNYTWHNTSDDTPLGKKGDSSMSKEYRTPLAAALLMCVMIMLSACGTPIQPSTASQAVEYQHDMGVTKITGTPDKIAAADYRILDTLYALGVKPFATTTYGGSTVLPYMDKDQQNADIIPLGDRINLEAAAENEPDLIIARHIEPDVYEQLSKVAPVIVFRGEGDWREEMKEIGDIVGKSAEADAWLEQYDQRTTALKDKIAEHVGPDETFLFMRIQKNVQVASPDVHLAATLSKDLGLQYVPQLSDMKETYETLSLETLPELNPDHIFLTVGKSTVSQDEEAEKLLEEMKQSAVWSSLKAVQAGNIHVMPQWVFGDYPNIKNESLDLVEAALVKP